MIAVNDTLYKYSKMRSATKSWSDDGDTYQKLYKNKNYITHADKEGKYEIKAKLTDTLYFYSIKYFTQKYKVADIIKKKIKVQLEPEHCVPYVPCEQKQPSNLYIFVGEKISKRYEEDPYYCRVVTLDGGAMKYKYKIIDEVYGHYPSDTIEFKSYSHLGRPMIEYYDKVLLFVGEYCGKLYQEKYQFFDVYKTKDGRWASPGDPYKFDNYTDYKKDASINIQPIEFDPFVRINTKIPDDEEYPERLQTYEAPCYRFIGNIAVPLMGTYIEDLIKVKMNGALKDKNIDTSKIKIK
ncbi:hypothetical protein GCM10023210_33010 [Chryseobacterium ginsengisoli]|uniref:Uncharacterized protein n=1 Tax=Chryseobacterium ginsengisoli TaxID=363853 RepID=A0ABP9MK46_9FLAO